MFRKLAKRICGFLIVVSYLCVLSCSFPRIYIDLVNHTTSTVIISYSHIGMKIQERPLCYDTIRYEIEPGKSEKICFPVMCRKEKVFDKICKLVPFVIFETPDKSICYDKIDELIRLFAIRTDNKNEYKFVITDSLFDCRK